MKKNAYTLVELTIAIAVLSLVIFSAMNTLSNVIKSRERLTRENLLYNESRLVMGFLTEAIRDNLIDYSEYYNQYVKEGDYGANYYYYATRFIDPGESCTDLNDGVNTILSLDDQNSDLQGCCYKDGYYYTLDSGYCDTDSEPTSTGEDQWSGQNPYSADTRYNKDVADASAFCDNDNISSKRKCSEVDNQYENDKLYLLSPDLRGKTIFGRESVYVDQLSSYIGALSYVEMEGEDTNSVDGSLNSDGIIDKWSCSSFFNCTAGTNDLPNKNDFTRNYSETNVDLYFKDFIPLSSFDINVTDLKFYISPLEDPNLAYGEDSIKLYPSVTVVLTTKLSDNSDILGNIELKLQTTVTPQYQEINTYRIE